jgi:hypothetical protein
MDASPPGVAATARSRDLNPAEPTVTQSNDDRLRLFVPAFEDQMAMVGRPLYAGGFRWFRSPNVYDLVAHRRRHGTAPARSYVVAAPVVRFVRRRRVGQFEGRF